MRQSVWFDLEFNISSKLTYIKTLNAVPGFGRFVIEQETKDFPNPRFWEAHSFIASNVASVPCIDSAINL
jgi:hypothetical protein